MCLHAAAAVAVDTAESRKKKQKKNIEEHCLGDEDTKIYSIVIERLLHGIFFDSKIRGKLLGCHYFTQV